jgi:hypothetical protein
MVSADGKKAVLATIRVREEQLEELKRVAWAKGMSEADLIRFGIDLLLEREGMKQEGECDPS